MATYQVMRSWTTEKPDDDEFISDKLEAMSRDGWELVFVIVLRHEGTRNSKVQYIFKYRTVDSGR